MKVDQDRQPLLQTLLSLGGIQPYVTAGLGGYSERLAAHHAPRLGVNTGAGVKVSLADRRRVTS